MDDPLFDIPFLKSVGFGPVEGAPEWWLKLGPIVCMPEYKDRLGKAYWFVDGHRGRVIVPDFLVPKGSLTLVHFVAQILTAIKENGDAMTGDDHQSLADLRGMTKKIMGDDYQTN